jgi:protein-S-isoprenylcysteine O-methyltransferase Ste14
MEKKRTWEGIGPKLALVTLPFIILSIILMQKDPGFLKMNFLNKITGNITGYALLITGVIFYVYSAKIFFADFKTNKLIKRGTYGLCRNPIYATFIVFIVPSLSFLFLSGMIILMDLVLYINFKVLIHEEYDALKENFGDEYEKYKKSVNEIIPLPKFWNKSKKT